MKYFAKKITAVKYLTPSQIICNKGLKRYFILDNYIENNKIVIIHTDSQYSMTCFTSTTITKKKVDKIPNYDYVIKGNNLCKSHLNIKFHHVKAHTSNKDIHSIGNDNADRLANLAIINDIGKINYIYTIICAMTSSFVLLGIKSFFGNIPLFTIPFVMSMFLLKTIDES